eukprot:CAMPEP_0116041778 /NCGR_PEP_ID=MMETSP0321-20121206/25269_1 /TAXON_ID=163516 /ORGANISM="Leptocylindrus danicus var. danicus, Strain B650" /LENGTH=363 /DNA_ID=CAMNT_0003522073 /DNA_START=46 /DNA_END=1137 /DNA_ORIENTATION=+
MSDNPSWAWLGLLKWTLAYTDGTTDTKPQEMSAEDKAFLEDVMKNGIINEGERMREILKELTDALDTISRTGDDGEESADIDEEQEDRMIELLTELRDIVEQIDYAKSFVSIKGLPFLLGCASQGKSVPEGVRGACVGVVSTLSQNNPPVQQALLDLEAVRVLAEIYFDDSNGSSLKVKVVQAISCIVRGHVAAEEAFTNDDVCRMIIERGLGSGESASLRRRCLFFLRALVCSDHTSQKRVRLFKESIKSAITFVDVEQETDDDIRQSALDLLLQILLQKKSVNCIMGEKNRILAVGVPRVANLRALPDGLEEKEFYEVELETWENLIVELAKGLVDVEEAEPPVLLLGGRPPDDTGANLPQ